MTKLTEQCIFSPFIGKSVNQEALTKLSRAARESEYIVCNSKYVDDQKYCDLFGITPVLLDRWLYSGVDFELHLFLNGDILCRGFIDKYRETGGGHGRPSIHVLTPTQQELRIARRILYHITK